VKTFLSNSLINNERTPQKSANPRKRVNWYRTGQNAAAEMHKLTTYLGHSSPENTYWYIEAVPELLDLASARVSDFQDAEAGR